MDYKGELTPLESRLVECAAAGDELDCAPTGTTTAEFDQIDDWEERKIRAEVLVDLCTGEVADWSVHPRRGLRLRGAYIAGQVDLSRAQLTQCPLAFHTCRFEEDIVLYQAATTDLSFTSCALPALDGAGLTSSGSLHLTDTRLRQVSFNGASFRGAVKLSEVRLTNPAGYAITADGISASDVFLTGSHFEGEVRLVGANIGGQFTCSEGTTLINPEGTALDVDDMSARSMFLNSTHIRGELRVLGANISGELYCGEGTTLINPDGYAISADGISASRVFLIGTHVRGEVRLPAADLSGELYCDEGTTLINPGGYAIGADSLSARRVLINSTQVKGEVRLVGAHIGGTLSCSRGTTLINPRGYALNAESCQVGGTFVFRLGEAAVGEVNLAYAQVGTLVDELASWPDTYNLVGFSYHSIGGDESLDRRLRWISNSTLFSPHVYGQLAEVYRRSGHEGFARQVAIKREIERGRQPDLSWGVRAWNYFLGLTVAYGYQPWRALVPLVVLFALGWFLFSLSPAQEAMIHIKDPTSAAACHEPFPCFSPPIYVLDTLLPIIDLHQERNWVPARPRPWGVWYEVLTWVLIGSGWILTTAVVAGIGSLWRRE